jgi:hypothetical protein
LALFARQNLCEQLAFFVGYIGKGWLPREQLFPEWLVIPLSRFRNGHGPEAYGSFKLDYLFATHATRQCIFPGLALGRLNLFMMARE